MYLAWAIRLFTAFAAVAALILFSNDLTEIPETSPAPESTDVEEEIVAEAPKMEASIIDVAEDGRDLRSIIESAPNDAVIRLPGNAESQIRPGPVEVTSRLTIQGADELSAITTDGLHGAFHIAPGGALHLERIKIRDAAGPHQPAIDNRGYLVLHDVVIRDNSAISTAAALRSGGSLLAKELRLHKNTSNAGPGAIEFTGGDAYLRGLTAIDNHGFHGGVLENHAALDISDAYFASNSADEGGAILNRGKIDLRNGAFWLNRGSGSDSFGGALLSERILRMTNTTFHANEATFGSALVVDAGQTDLAHITFHANPSRAGSDVYVGSRGTLRTRNSVFSSGDSTVMSIDIVGTGDMKSLGGNIVPRPAGNWPERLAGPADWLGTGEDTPPTKEPIGANGWIRLVPLAEDHPGRLNIPAKYCRDARDRPLSRDQSGNPRSALLACDAGAHQTSPTPHGEPTTRPQ